MQNTYWNNNGKYQALATALGKLIPISGPIANARKNPKLEKFHKAQNCYYDLYNNGLCNRKAEFRSVFGFSASEYAHRPLKLDHNGNMYRCRIAEHSDVCFRLVENAIDAIILDAAAEQNITIEDYTI